MLSSLLPGVRDVRTPLACGYLWLLNLWLWMGESLLSSPLANTIAETLAPLSFVSDVAALAALSFCAYLLGSLVNLPVERGLVSTRIRSLYPTTFNARQTKRAYAELVADLHENLSSGEFAIPREAFGEIKRGAVAGPADLRPRLLVANQELYGEYDRLAAEGAFRLNIAPALMALILTLTSLGGAKGLLGILFLLPVILLAIQGWNRLQEADSVLRGAVLAGIVEHPLATISQRAVRREP